MKNKVLAFDFGASSGRAMLFEYENEQLSITEMHRFPNDGVMVQGTYYWDILRLFFEIKQGILKTVNAGHKDIQSIGIDTWGVDFCLFDEQGNVLKNPTHYRDSRTDGMIEYADQLVGKKTIFQSTGIQFNFFNTLLQLLSMTKGDTETLSRAKNMLFMPDTFNYFLTGMMKNEYTIASTSQMMDANSKTWDIELLQKLNIPTDMLGEIIMPGEIVGYLTDDICEELGCDKIPVVAVGSHDTASAVASVPVTEDYNYAYISSGTWALMGVEIDRPIINDKSFAYAMTNEGGVCGKTRFLKNIMGLWIIQESRNQWKREGTELSFDQLELEAWSAAGLVSFINPDDESFVAPGNMPKRIRKYCEKTNQPVPQTQGDIIRTIAQSLALKCAQTLRGLEDILGEKLDVIHMMGGGIKDAMVCQFIANATGKRVIAGPVEATSTGNALLQLMALCKIENLAQARQIVKNSFPVKEYTPQDTPLWKQAYDTFVDLASC